LIAAACEHLEDYIDAAKAHLQTGNKARAATCFDLNRQYTQAASLWEEVGELERAKASYIKVKDWQEVIRICQQQNTSSSWLEAAHLLEIQLKEFSTASDIYARYRQPIDAKRCFETYLTQVRPQWLQDKLSSLAATEKLFQECQTWEQIADELVKVNEKGIAKQFYQTILNDRLNRLAMPPCPKELPIPTRLTLPKLDDHYIQKTIQKVGFWGAVGTGILAGISAPVAIGVAAIGAIAIGIRTSFEYEAKMEKHERRIQEIAQWETTHQAIVQKIRIYQGRLEGKIYACSL
jgi:tetratricopeptide (TPR) repeat protein